MSALTTDPKRNRQMPADNARLLKKLVVIAGLMFGFGFALVPLYEKLCTLTGIRSLLRADHIVAQSTQVDFSRQVTVEFDSNTHNLPWTFKPVSNFIELHPGEMQQIVYEVRNNTDHPITGQAIPSYSPQRAGQFFKKVQCFCFDQQTLAAREVRRMPVVFVVDPELPRDVHTITLSFTFFEVAGAGKAGS